MRWVDTTNGVLKRRDASNATWITDSSETSSPTGTRTIDVPFVLSDIGRLIRATASFTQTFGAAATLGNGWNVDYRVESGVTITFDPNGSESIDGGTTLVVTGPASLRIWCSGSAFFTVGLSSFSTGDVKLTFKTAADTGWVLMNDGTIGSATSGATTRANADTSALFTLLWNNTANADCAVSGGRGASAAADFSANKTIALPKALGRALAGYGSGSGLSSRALASITGVETHTLSTSEMPAHSHPSSTVVGKSQGGSGGATSVMGGADIDTSITLSIASQGGGNAHPNMQPTLFLNVMIRL
jgi:hypothetical protein